MQIATELSSTKNIILLSLVGILIVIPVYWLLYGHNLTTVDGISLLILGLLTYYIHQRMGHDVQKDHMRWKLIFMTEILLVSLAVYFYGGVSASIYKMYFIIIVQMAITSSTKFTLGGITLIILLYGLAGYFSPHTAFQFNTWIVNSLYLMGSIIPLILFVRREYQIRMQNEELFKNVSEANKQLTEYALQIQELAVTDSLTKLYNQIYIHERLMIEVEIARKNNAMLSIAFFDIDDFKKVNDTYGHQYGDQILRAIGAIVLKNAGGCRYIAGRYGGEELIVIMPQADKAQASYVADQIRQQVSQLNVCTESGECVSVTVSVGIATFPFDANDKESLTKLADLAMYKAKRLGKNRIVSSVDN